MNALLIPTDAPKAKQRTNAKKSRKSFSLGLDELTHLALVELQKALTGPALRPSRTLVTREALRHYAREVRVRVANGDRDWIEGEMTTITHLARNSK
jgi:hypothetical protein